MKEAELPSTFEVGHRNHFTFSHHLHCPRDLFIIIISSLSFFIFFVIAEVLQSRLHWRGCARRPPLQKDLPSLVGIDFSVIISNLTTSILYVFTVLHRLIIHIMKTPKVQKLWYISKSPDIKYPLNYKGIETIRQCIAMTGRTKSEIDCVHYLLNKQWIENLPKGQQFDTYVGCFDLQSITTKKVSIWFSTVIDGISGIDGSALCLSAWSLQPCPGIFVFTSSASSERSKLFLALFSRFSKSLAQSILPKVGEEFSRKPYSIAVRKGSTLKEQLDSM